MTRQIQEARAKLVAEQSALRKWSDALVYRGQAAFDAKLRQFLFDNRERAIPHAELMTFADNA